MDWKRPRRRFMPKVLWPLRFKAGCGGGSDPIDIYLPQDQAGVVRDGGAPLVAGQVLLHHRKRYMFKTEKRLAATRPSSQSQEVFQNVSPLALVFVQVSWLCL